jgi:hypothetical protein
LNDVSSEQALRFKPRSKMNMYLRSVSGSRPESVIAQALATSGVKNTGVAEDLAARLRYVYERGEEPVALEATVASVVARAQQTQTDIYRTRDAAVNTEQPLDQVVSQQDKAVQTQVKEDEVRADMEQALVEHKEEIDATPTNVPSASSSQSERKFTKKQLLSLYERYRQNDQVPTSQLRGEPRQAIIAEILIAKPGKTIEELYDDRARMQTFRARGVDSLQNEQAAAEHRERVRTRLAGTESETGPSSEAETTVASSSAQEEVSMAKEETSEARTAAARFEERNRIPDWVSAFAHEASDIFRGERGGEGLARRANP